jgi:hypothetical protein
MGLAVNLYNRLSNMLDADDRRVLAQGAVIVAAAAAILVTTAASLAAAAAVAVRVFTAIVG